ncbi:hypothetical protein ACFW5I_21155 [Streptomyces sp. NPDC058818]|uniref:hypothetical protein n=1 Tax=Streptomyces sp. NPDC058818 TaxID=3346640 RepID=UPI00369BE8CF
MAASDSPPRSSLKRLTTSPAQCKAPAKPAIGGLPDEQTSYTYDDLGNLASIGSYLTDIDYAALAQPQTLTSGTGDTSVYIADKFGTGTGRLTHSYVQDKIHPYRPQDLTYTYTYDQTGNVTQIRSGPGASRRGPSLRARDDYPEAMRYRWDWLRPVVQAPYVPTIGPVHPSVLTEDLFTDTPTAANTDRWFLRYDKDIRWSDGKDESVLVEGIVHRPGQTLIPTLSRRGAGVVKVHLYGTEPDSVPAATGLARNLAAEHGAGTARVVRFLGPESPDGRGTRIRLKDFRTAVCAPLTARSVPWTSGRRRQQAPSLPSPSRWPRTASSSSMSRPAVVSAGASRDRSGADWGSRRAGRSAVGALAERPSAGGADPGEPLMPSDAPDSR